MRSLTLLFLLIFFTLGCTGPGTTTTSHKLQSQPQACLSLSPFNGDTSQTSLPCRSEPRLLERVGNALGGFASAMRDPNQ